MAVNKIQNVDTAKDLYGILQGMANEMERVFSSIESANVVLGTFSGSDLTDLSVPAPEQTIMAQFRVLLGEIEDARAGTLVTPAVAWDAVIQKIHSVRPF